MSAGLEASIHAEGFLVLAEELPAV
jgi:hypothetical protein